MSDPDLREEIGEFMEQFDDHVPTDEEVRSFFARCSVKLIPGDEVEQRRFVEMMMRLREPLPGERPDA